MVTLGGGAQGNLVIVSLPKSPFLSCRFGIMFICTKSEHFQHLLFCVFTQTHHGRPVWFLNLLCTTNIILLTQHWVQLLFPGHEYKCQICDCITAVASYWNAHMHVLVFMIELMRSQKSIYEYTVVMQWVPTHKHGHGINWCMCSCFVIFRINLSV